MCGSVERKLEGHAECVMATVQRAERFAFPIIATGTPVANPALSLAEPVSSPARTGRALEGARMQGEDIDYLRHDQFDFTGDETDIRLRRIRMVTIRKPQTCVPPPSIGKEVHEIAPGTRARLETALVEGVFGKCYTCTECLDIWLSPPFEGR